MDFLTMKSFKLIFVSFLILIIFGCEKNKKNEKVENENVKVNLELSLEQANRLASLPLKCMQNEYPNKTGQTLSSDNDLGSPKELHPAFYGCYDWHSSVHGHWTLVKLLKDFPNLENRDSILTKLTQNLSEKNIATEIDYFSRKHEYSYERTYGWAWLLKLQEELNSWQSKEGIELSKHLQPLTDIIVKRFEEFIPKLNYPLRVGTHTNTAFGMSFAYDYALASHDEGLKLCIVQNAKRLFQNDIKCPINWEPSGTDFLSPCLEEVSLMQRVLPNKEFLQWMNEFLPELAKKDFDLEVGKVSDRKDGHLVHLDGLNFSRAWVFYRLSKEYPDQYGHLKNLGDIHLSLSLPAITDGSYEGEHWLASFALYALSER